MNTQIMVLTDHELDTVSGGMANTGVGKEFQKPPITAGSGNSGLLGFVEQLAGVVVAGTKDGFLFGPLGTII
jgi:hypothetical protein